MLPATRYPSARQGGIAHPFSEKWENRQQRVGEPCLPPTTKASGENLPFCASLSGPETGSDKGLRELGGFKDLAPAHHGPAPKASGPRASGSEQEVPGWAPGLGGGWRLTQQEGGSQPSRGVMVFSRQFCLSSGSKSTGLARLGPRALSCAASRSAASLQAHMMVPALAPSQRRHSPSPGLWHVLSHYCPWCLAGQQEEQKQVQNQKQKPLLAADNGQLINAVCTRLAGNSPFKNLSVAFFSRGSCEAGAPHPTPHHMVWK